MSDKSSLDPFGNMHLKMLYTGTLGQEASPDDRSFLPYFPSENHKLSAYLEYLDALQDEILRFQDREAGAHRPGDSRRGRTIEG